MFTKLFVVISNGKALHSLDKTLFVFVGFSVNIT